MALSGHSLTPSECPLSGRTLLGVVPVSANDPKRTLSGRAKSLAIRMGGRDQRTFTCPVCEYSESIVVKFD